MKDFFLVLVVCMLLLPTEALHAQTTNKLIVPKIGVNVGTSDSPEDFSATLQILLLMTILSLAPSLMIMTTSYLRLIIVFYFLRNALGTMQMPPNQLLAGMALFITFFIMQPTWNSVYTDGLQPYLDKRMSIDSAYTKGIEPIRQFMFKNVRDQDLELFIQMANMQRPGQRDELPTHILIPAFILSELRAGFIIGFFLFIPFLIVDMIVSSVLMSMGMMMLPPMMVSLPFKILLFVLVDGWNLIVGSLVRSFQ